MLHKNTLAQPVISERYFSEFACMIFGTFLMFCASQITIPLEPVPITLQTFGVLLISLIFERKTAIKSMALYLSLGAMGTPVFASLSGGVACLMGPTGGYLFGFLVCVMVVTTIRKHLKNTNLFTLLFSALLGTVVIMGFGVAWLSMFIGFKSAINAGLLPFIVPGLAKAALLAMLVRFLRLDKINS